MEKKKIEYWIFFTFFFSLTKFTREKNQEIINSKATWVFEIFFKMSLASNEEITYIKLLVFLFLKNLVQDILKSTVKLLEATDMIRADKGLINLYELLVTQFNFHSFPN